MKDINVNVSIISPDGGDFAYFFSKKEMYEKLSGIKDDAGDNMEFIEIGRYIYLNDDKLKVLDINVKFDNIDHNIHHKDKTENSMPKNLIIELIITVQFIEKNIKNIC